MDRRKFIKVSSSLAWGAVALSPGTLFLRSEEAIAEVASAASGTGAVPKWAGHMLDSDMQGLGPDGKATGQKATFTGASRANAKVEEAAISHKMTLTK